MNEQKEKTVKVSFQQVRLFRINAVKWLQNNPTETKFKYALEKVFKRTDAIESKWSEKLSNLELDHAAVGENNVVLFTINEKGERVYSFTKEGLRKKDKEVELEFTKEDTNELEPYYVEDLPKEMPEGLVTVFTPFIIRKREEE